MRRKIGSKGEGGVTMTKAILELEKAPKSCRGGGCPFYKIGGYCDILSSRNNSMPIYTPSIGKREDCPLKEMSIFKKNIINDISQWLQDNGFEEASKAMDCEFEL